MKDDCEGYKTSAKNEIKKAKILEGDNAEL